MKIVDATNGEEVIASSTYLSSHTSEAGENEAVEMEVGSMMRAFNKKVRAMYEDEYYQDKNEEE